MSIAANDRIKRTNISAADTGPHSCDFPLLDKNEVVVKVIESDGTVNSYTVDVDYTVGSVPGDTPTVTFIDGDDVPAGVLVLQGNEDIDQTYTGADTNATREAYRDKTAKIQQQINEKVSRALKFALHSTLTDKVFPEYSLADYGKVIGVNASGELAITTLAALEVALTSIGQSIATAVDAAAVRAAIGLVLGTDIYSKTAADALYSLYLPLLGGTMTGVLDMNGNQITMGGAVINMETAKIINVTDPTSAQDAATKAYIDAAAGVFSDPFTYREWHEDFIALSASSYADGEQVGGGLSAIANGTSAEIAVGTAAAFSNSHPSVVELQTGTDTTGKAGLASRGRVYLGGGVMTWIGEVKFPNLADGTDDYDFYLGIADSFNVVASAITDGVYFKYDRDANTNWLICAQASSTETATDSGVAVAADWVQLKIVINAAASSIEYFIDGVSVGTVTTNIPTSQDLYFNTIIDKEAGTTERTCQVDLVGFQQVIA